MLVPPIILMDIHSVIVVKLIPPEFKSLLKEYIAEGYDKEEAGKFARKEVNEMMVEKEDFVHQLWDEAYEEE